MLARVWPAAANKWASPPSTAPSTLAARIAIRARRDLPLALLDLCAVFAAYLIVLVLRFDGSVPVRYWQLFWAAIPGIAIFHLAANFVFGLYGRMWMYASVQEARRVIMAGSTAVVLIVIADLQLSAEINVLPLSVVLLGGVLSVMGFGTIRFQSRLFALRRRSVARGKRRVLVFGAGDAGSSVLKDLLRNPSFGLEPVVLADDDPRKFGFSLHGVQVRGNRTAIPELVSRFGVEEVLLAIPSATSEVVRDVAGLCEEADVALRVLPSVKESVAGRITARDIRDLRIEDLLGRQQVETDLDAVAGILRDKRVLVTGAGGSIGSEISRQVAGFHPAALILLDHDETLLHEILGDIEDVPAEGVLGDIRDRGKLAEVFLAHRPEIVFHAAAHKHVPVLERYPDEALLTNVIGTANTVDAALVAGTQRFVLISTDKAVKPKSVMGASKRFAEQIVWSSQGGSCRFCSVRFGNVLGSRGSVIPTFLRQIARGGPVTVTDPAMTRYFMSVHEAVQLVLQAAALSAGGEVFTLEMGEPVNMLELAKRVIRLSGRVPNKDIQIAVTGVRPGEKVVEDLIDPLEEGIPSGHPSITAARCPAPDRGALRRFIRQLEVLAAEGRHAELARLMKLLAEQPAVEPVSEEIRV